MTTRTLILSALFIISTASAAADRPPPPGETPQADSSRCEKRYCKEMKSCAEARYYLTQCKRSSFDKDGDGLPCENVCKR